MPLIPALDIWWHCKMVYRHIVSAAYRSILSLNPANISVISTGCACYLYFNSLCYLLTSTVFRQDVCVVSFTPTLCIRWPHWYSDRLWVRSPAILPSYRSMNAMVFRQDVSAVARWSHCLLSVDLDDIPLACEFIMPVVFPEWLLTFKFQSHRDRIAREYVLGSWTPS